MLITDKLLKSGLMKKIIFTILQLFLIILPVYPEQLDFNDFMSAALNNSYKLKTSHINLAISHHGVKEAKAAYLPTISAYATTERYNDLTKGNAQITAVGNEILLNRSYYQDMAAIGLTYNIFDFGIRRKELDIAKADDKQKLIVLMKDTKDLKLDAVDIYADALVLYKQSVINSEKLSLQNELISINKRLRTAGELSEVDLVDSEIVASETKSELDEVKNNLAKKLTEISYYTNENYNIKDIELNDFPKDISGAITDTKEPVKLSATLTEFIPEESVEAKVYDLEIFKKQKEYEIQKKANFPKIRFDTRYNFYGSDPHNFFYGLDDISQRSVTIRLSTSFTLFDGLKNINTIAKKKLEVEKIKIEKAQQLAELKKKYEQIQLDCQNAITQTENNEATLELVNKNLDMLKRLHTNGIAAKSECIKKQLELLDKKLKLEQNRIKNFTARYKMHILNTENYKL